MSGCLYGRIAKENSIFFSSSCTIIIYLCASMFRYIIATVMIFSFTAQMLGGFMVEIDYYLRIAEYAKNCINKARPLMHCNGKCQMAKRITQEEKKDQQAPERKSVNKNEITLSSKCFFASINLPVFSIVPSVKRLLYFP